MNSRRTFEIGLALFLAASPATLGQQAPDSAHQSGHAVRIVFSLVGGYSQTLTSIPPPIGDFSNGGLQGSLRILVTRDRLLDLGFETGYFPISSERIQGLQTTDIEAALFAVPVLFSFGLNIGGADLHAGLGYYYYGASTSVFGDRASSHEWDMGYSASAGYSHWFTDWFAIGGELRIGGIFDRDKSFISGGVRVRMRAFEL